MQRVHVTDGLGMAIVGLLMILGSVALAVFTDEPLLEHALFRWG